MNLRTLTAIISLAMFATTLVYAQPPQDIRQANADYPIPTPAALVTLQSQDAPLFLAPSTIRNAVFATNGLWGVDAQSVAFGAEFAPFLIGDAISISDYLQGRLFRVLVRTRISFAAQISGGSAFNTAFGLRWMLHDDADLGADSLFQRTMLQWEREHREPQYDSLRTALKEVFWNRSVVEIAYSGVFQSTLDENGKSVFAARQFHGFLSAGFPLLGTSGQLQFGISSWAGRAEQDLRYQRQGAVTVRGVYGTASERIVVGVQLLTSNLSEPDYRAELGGMFRIANGLWLQPDLGISLHRRSERDMQARITVGFGTPEI